MNVLNKAKLSKVRIMYWIVPIWSVQKEKEQYLLVQQTKRHANVDNWQSKIHLSQASTMMWTC